MDTSIGGLQTLEAWCREAELVERMAAEAFARFVESKNLVDAWAVRRCQAKAERREFYASGYAQGMKAIDWSVLRLAVMTDEQRATRTRMIDAAEEAAKILRESSERMQELHRMVAAVVPS